MPAQARPVDPARLFRDLVTQHSGRLRRFVIKHIGHPDDADDIAQQAFMEAARSIEHYRGESELSTWLYGIAMNLVRNYLNRAPHRLYRFDSEESLAGVPAPMGDPSEIVARQETLHSLDEMLAELPEDMRDVLMLVAVDELSYEAAAAILSVPVGTVRSRLSRARATLKMRLEEAGIDTTF
jgi:RNA polymerase sigma-70 factor (ECF subfamily)